MHRLFIRIILHTQLRAGHYAALELEKKHVTDIVRHEIHVQKAKLWCRRSLVNLEQSRLVIDSAVLIEPCLQVLHRSESEREGVRSLSPDQRVQGRGLLYRRNRRHKAVPSTNVKLMQ